MRLSKVLPLPMVCAATLLPACLPDRCKSPSANIELTVSFSGFSLSSAKRVEFETSLEAPGPTSGAPNAYYERRLGSVAYPLGGLSAEITYRLHTGTYVNQVTKRATSFRLIIRVYGEKNGQQDALLAEGSKRWAPLSAKACYIDERMQVTTQPSCANKLEGDPCVSPSQDWQPRGVCQPSGDALQCRPSRCGDGFTDRRAGEICDPGPDATPREPCTTDCLAFARQVVAIPPDDSAPPLFRRSSAQGTVSGLSESTGIWTLDATPTADLLGSLLVTDVDGDGTDELYLGLPGAPYDHPNIPDGQGCPTTVVGVVYGFDWPMVGDLRYGSVTGPHVRINGPCDARSSRGASFGASLAAGDLDGDGALDLVVGAPRADGNDNGSEGGQVFVLFGGTDGAIPIEPSPEMDVVGGDFPIQTYVGTNGDWGVERPGDYLGYTVAVADFDLDGYSDLALAAPQRKVPRNSRLGAVYLIRGGPGFRERAANAVEVGTLTTFLIQSGFDRIRARLGVSLATGDVNGDGYPDLVMGSTSGDATTHEGGLAILFGHDAVFEREGGAAQADVFPFTPTAEGDLLSLDVGALGLGAQLQGLGGTVAVVDLDGDGLAEVAATLGRAPLGDAPGAVAILSGAYFDRLLPVLQASDMKPPGPEELTLLQGPADADFGLSLAAVDASGDRRPDLLIGAPGEAYAEAGNPSIPQAGAVYVLVATPRGAWFSPTGPKVLDLVSLRGGAAPPVPLLWLRGVRENGRFGTAMAGSSHLPQSSDKLEHRSAYTNVFEPGWAPSSGVGANAGRVWTFFLPNLLPCESLDSCVPP